MSVVSEHEHSSKLYNISVFFLSKLNTVFLVISVPRQVAERLEPSDDSSGPSLIDYSEKRSLPISIPDYQTITNHGEHFVVCYVNNRVKQFVRY